ncbi:MAG: 23S rRNA (adenine(2503)-C(2))-methyltransferase RlmN [bacterium]|nr:23S rRNA (adenine(2503)-C(2))-methyltransferase RlmN [bacterium]
MRNIYDLTLNELENYLLSINEKKYRAIQIYDFLYVKKVASFDDMTNLSLELRNKLKEDFVLEKPKLIKEQQDVDVNKYLFKLSDGNLIETVLMKHNYGLSLCVSSEVGCNMGCIFCESGRLKKVRNLSAYELVTQILYVEELTKSRITHVVIMGIGEPFDNYDNIMKFVTIVNDPKGLALGSRHITISTCGIVPKIKKFSEEPFQVNLAISLHAPTDSLRSKIMPINKVYPLDDLINAVKDYIKKTNRRVTFEYILLDNVNDKDSDAIALAKLLKGINCYVNLIPYNESSNFTLKRSNSSQIRTFYDILKKNNINVTIRREFGSKISAACGQLRSNKEE